MSSIRRELTAASLPRAVLRQKWKAALAFFCLLGIGAAAGMLWPSSYRSEAKLLVRLGRENVTLDPTATTGQTIHLNESRQLHIHSIQEMLQSRGLLAQVAEQVGAAAILGEPAGAPSESDALDRAIEALQGGLQVWTAKETSVITVSFEGRSPQLAQQVVQALLELYREEHQRVHRTAGSFDFFAEQEELHRRGLDEAERSYRDAKSEMGIASVEGRRQILHATLGAIDTQIVQNDTELAGSQAKIERLAASIDTLPERLLVQETTGHPNSAADSMRQTLYALQIREQELLSRYTADHPEVVAVRSQVRDARLILDQQVDERTQHTSAVHPARQLLEIDLLKEESSAAALVARGAALRAEHDKAIEELRTLNDQEVRLAALDRDVQTAAKRYGSYSEKLEQARIEEALERQDISNVSVVQAATLERRPAGPQRGLIVAFSAVLAVFAGVGAAAAAELFDRRLRSIDEAEEQLQIPVLASIPRMPREPATAV